MNQTDLKLAIFNGLAFTLSFSHIENTLKIILLLASIIYTSYKTYDLHKKHKNNGSDNTSED